VTLLIADLAWGLRRAALITLWISSILVLPWLVVGLAANIFNGG